jgi:hypothetical protein
VLRHILLTSLLLAITLCTLGADNDKGYRTLYLELNNGYEIYVGRAGYMQIHDGYMIVKTEEDYLQLSTAEVKGWRYEYAKDVITSTPIITGESTETAVSYSNEGIYITLPDTSAIGNSISIYNIEGEIVRQLPYTSSIFISYTELPSGINIILIPGDNGYSTIKLNVK